MDLFNYTPPADYSQGELAGPSMHIGRRCKTCRSPMTKTVSGFDSCVLGCGKLKIPADYDQAQIENVTLPVWTRKETR
jgi:hypothetical protein